MFFTLLLLRKPIDSKKGRVSGYILYPNSAFLFFRVLRTVFDDCLYVTSSYEPLFA
ncbi:protein of unknown function [Paenibacillus alvei]|uniref:Uncharacterized protein n=1 Tax=Paenibacillus alvei TaxID=44250 RepID=A0A383R4J8_PAEAL|nr:protein of unknown function [Paenibacillus alvei]